jgi:citrate lyase beta subunit
VSTFDEPLARDLIERLERANAEHALSYPGDPVDRRPIHVVYGGAQRFKFDTAANFGRIARKLLQTYAPGAAEFAAATGVPESIAKAVRARVVAKLESEPVEDFRIDFEDGYGHRSDAEEDIHAIQSAAELARGAQAGSLPPFSGIRIKPLTLALHRRAIRTLDLFLTEAIRVGGSLPPNFSVTLPKVTIPEQVATLADLLALAESKRGLPHGSIRIELMIETPPAIVNREGCVTIPRLLEAAGGRCRSVHFGPYDYTSNCNITSEHQMLTHPACDFARHVIQVATAGTGVTVSDGPTGILPIPPHRGKALTAGETGENRDVIYRALRLHYNHVTHALSNGIYQGWGLHPAQLPARYAAVYAYFLRNLAFMTTRLRNFIENAAQATATGDVFDDAASGHGLLNFFLRGHACGALTEAEVAATGLSVAEVSQRSFLAIVETRRVGHTPSHKSGDS